MILPFIRYKDTAIFTDWLLLFLFLSINGNGYLKEAELPDESSSAWRLNIFT
ncbi:hypothetical protein HMPREF9193_01968 [Treponema lecithinolyticum ATCC 700332]|uniref:Uncharacterized protein n=1 Tax=Treponema lecithinolyticum ATCC 700332 TaxID=1321815 RepID=A0ABN0NWL3_TRELE|nr:hypothetical protein HMPREF9193_01968 [Treponema lecithinolyticum ATCC 700332]